MPVFPTMCQVMLYNQGDKNNCPQNAAFKECSPESECDMEVHNACCETGIAKVTQEATAVVFGALSFSPVL